MVSVGVDELILTKGMRVALEKFIQKTSNLLHDLDFDTVTLTDPS